MFIVFVAVVFRYLDFSEIWGRWDMIATQGSREVSVHSRVLVRDAAIDMLKTQGLRGVGAGGFRYLFPEYVQNYPEIYEGGTLYWEHAHCDWLEFPIELGLAGDLLILGGAGWWIAFFVRRRAFWNALAVPLLLGCLQTVIHAGFDFPFQCPAILVTWCMIVAIAGRWIELEPSATERTEG
jgi:O-antigen ligase